MPKALSKETVTLAYLRMVSARETPPSMQDALAEADNLCIHLGLDEESTGTTGGGTGNSVELSPQEAEGLRVLWALFKENKTAVGIKDFAAAMEIEPDAARKQLEKFATRGIAETSRRGRGIYFTPTAELPE